MSEPEGEKDCKKKRVPLQLLPHNRPREIRQYLALRLQMSVAGLPHQNQFRGRIRAQYANQSKMRRLELAVFEKPVSRLFVRNNLGALE